MENAVSELHQENNGGVLVWFLEILWAQSTKRIDSDDNDVPPAAYFKDFPYIPHTVVFNYSHAQGWFFEPASIKASSGSRRIRRKRRQHLVARDIFEELTTVPTDLQDDLHIVAQLITRQSPQSLQPKCTYLTRDALYQLLFHGTIAEGSILQKFVFPQGPHSNPLKNGNSTLTISWQPSYCYVERHVNQVALDDHSYTPKERGATSEAPRNITTTALGNNSSTLHSCRRACNAIAEHVRIVTGIHIRSLTCVVKITQSNEVALMFVQRVAIVENDRMTPSIGFLGGSAISDDEDDAHEAHVLGNTKHLTQGQKEHLMELKRCASSQKRNYLVALLPEDIADSKFERIAPRSWVQNRDSATRFQGRSSSACSSVSGKRAGSRTSNRGASTPNTTTLRPSSSTAMFANGSTSASPRATSPALGATRTLVSFDATNTFGASPTVGSFRSLGSMRVGKGLGNSMMREVEQDMTLKTQGTVVVRSDWNEEPTRIEVSLMRDATTDYFPLKKVAHNVAALGLREKYLASMRAASVNKRAQ